jgi:hypothetical protein
MQYNDEFTHILLEGAVKNGRFEGDWKGGTMDDDSIKLVYTFKKGELVIAKGIDKLGNAYPFTRAAEPASYKNGVAAFQSYMQRHLVLPKDSTTGKKIRNPIKVSFVVEKDGHLTHFKVVGNSNPALADAAINVLKLCPAWNPRRYYGVPVRSKIVIPLNIDTYPLFEYEEEVLDINIAPNRN